jgi:predicted transcriptional regulator
MSTTVQIDDDLLRELQARAEREQVSPTSLLRQILRRELGTELVAATEPRQPFRQRTSNLGELRIPAGLSAMPDKALAIAAALEDEETITQLARGK